MADRNVTVAVEVAQTSKVSGPPLGAPAGPPGPTTSSSSGGWLTDQFRQLGKMFQKAGGPVGTFGAAASNIVVSGLPLLTSGITKAVTAGVKAAGSMARSAGPGLASLSNFIQPSDAATKNVGPQLAAGFRSIALGLGIATAAASGFTAAMSPMTFSTLTGSVQLLGNEFVKLLIPAFSMASLTIQKVTAWMASLDDSTKNMISSTAMWAAPGLVALGILGALSPILRFVTGGVILLTQALWTSGRAALAWVLTPWGATLTAIAVSVGILTNGFGLLGDSIERAGARASETRERIARLSQPGAQLTRTDYESLHPSLRRAIEATPAAQRGAFLSQTIGTTRTQLEQIQATDPARMATIVEDALTRLNRSGFLPGQAISQTTDSRRRELIVDALAAQGVSRPEAQRKVGLVTEQQISAGRTPEQLTAAARIIALVDREASARERLALLERAQQQGIPGIFQGLRQSSPMQSQMFQSGSDAYYQVLQEVASRGQLEQDILREIMRNTATQVAIMQAQNGGVANPPPLPPGVQPP